MLHYIFAMNSILLHPNGPRHPESGQMNIQIQPKMCLETASLSGGEVTVWACYGITR